LLGSLQNQRRIRGRILWQKLAHPLKIPGIGDYSGKCFKLF